MICDSDAEKASKSRKHQAAIVRIGHIRVVDCANAFPSVLAATSCAIFPLWNPPGGSKKAIFEETAASLDQPEGFSGLFRY